MKHRNKLIALTAVAVVLAITGCGGDDEEADTGATGATGVSGAALTSSQFIAQADAICRSGGETIDEAAAAFDQAPEGAELEQFVDETIVPALQAQHDGIAALPAPEGQEDDIESLLSSIQDGIDEIEENPETLTEDSIFNDANEQAAELGLNECGDG